MPIPPLFSVRGIIADDENVVAPGQDTKAFMGKPLPVSPASRADWLSPRAIIGDDGFVAMASLTPEALARMR